MNWFEVIFGVGGIVGFLSGLSALIISLRKAKPEIRILDADAAAQYLKLAQDAGEELVEVKSKYDTEIGELKKTIDILQDKIITYESELGNVKAELALYRDHNDRLCHQVFSLGGTPVPMVVEPK